MLHDFSRACNMQGMANTPHTPSAEADQAITLLKSALGSAMDNLPDVVGDPTFGPMATAECCKDIAALAHLLATGDDGRCNIEAYL